MANSIFRIRRKFIGLSPYRRNDSLLRPQAFIAKDAPGVSEGIAHLLADEFWNVEYPFSSIPPTVVLNSPADASSGSDTTPTLDFTGTDPNGDDVRYNVQIDTVATLDSQKQTVSVGTPGGFVSAGVVVGGNFSGDIFVDATANKLVISAQIWQDVAGVGEVSQMTYNGIQMTKAAGYTQTSATMRNEIWYLDNPPTGTHPLVATLNGTTDGRKFGSLPLINAAEGYDTSVTGGGYGTSASDSITPSIDGCIIIDSLISYNGTVAVEGSTSFWENTTGSTNAAAQYYIQTTAASKAMTWSWTTAGDFAHLVVSFKPLGLPTLNKVSGTDAGFSGSPDNTDPFTSGQQVSYTVQSALSAGTYYWRVRGIDPLGSNLYGAWSSVRSFTITGGGTDVTATATVITATFSAPNPVITAIQNVSITPTVLSLTSSVVSPSVSLGSTISHSVLNLTANVISPTVTAIINVSTSATALSASFSVIQPTISTVQNVTVSPSVITATFTAPTAIAGISVIVESNILLDENGNYIVDENGNPIYEVWLLNSATFSVITPIVTAQLNGLATPSVQTATFSVNSPVITAVQNVSITPTVLTATFSVINPVVSNSTNVNVNVSVLTASFSLQNPVISGNSNISVNVATGTFSIIDPTVTTTSGFIDVTVNVSVLDLTVSVNNPTISTELNAIINAGVLSGTFSINNPSFQLDNIFSVSPVIATFSIVNPRVRTFNGIWEIESKNGSSWSKDSKHTANWQKENKSTATWSKTTKNTSNWTKETKHSAVWTK